MNEGLVWFLLGLAVGVAGATLFFGIRTSGRPAAAGPTGSGTPVRTSWRSLRIFADAVEVGGVRYRRLAEVPAADRRLVADEVRVSRDLLPPDAVQLAMIDAFLADDGEGTS